MIKKLVTGVAFSCVCAGALYAETVSVSNNGTGDFLIAPLYVAKGDICSNITVFNTNTTSSILAKVTFREKVASQEVDFPIFLSPGDVWDGKVCESANGVVLTSYDDSNHPAIADILKDGGKNLTEQSKSAGHTNVDFTTGYIEIYPIAQYNENSTEKIEKSVLVERWDTLAKGHTSDSKLKKDGVDGESLSGIVSFATLDTETASIPMSAFVGTHDKQVTGSAIAYSNDTSPELLLGVEKKNQILQLLQTDVSSFTFNNSGEDQFINLTFPFGYVANQTRTYKVTVRDMSENKDVEKQEVVIFSPAPKKIVKINTINNEMVKLSVADMISKTTNPEAFTKGMIQITEVKNLDNVQLGKGTIASFIPIKMTEGFLTVDKVNPKPAISSITYVPTK
jgi:hypothetical protein